MTREEAKQKVSSHKTADTHNVYYLAQDIKDYIDKIYDDFESRVCENCKYFLTKPTGYERCEKLETEVGFYFGCNWFERGKDG